MQTSCLLHLSDKAIFDRAPLIGCNGVSTQMVAVIPTPTMATLVGYSP
jgi:hypothetical protein